MRPTRVLTTLLVSLALAGCSGDGLSPDTVDPLSLRNDVESVAGTFSNNAAFQSLRVLSQHFPNYTGVALLDATLPAIMSPRSAAARRLSPRAQASLSGVRDIQALFPSNVLGKTLEWDVQTDTYVVGNQTGAPGSGIRILIYIVDPATDMPLEPLQQLGYVDLTDESTPQFDRLGVLLRLLGSTIADYNVTLTGGTTSVELRAVGRINSVDLARFADFNLSLLISGNPLSLTIDHDVSASDAIVVRLFASGAEDSGELTFSVGRAGNTITIDGTMDATSVDAIIQYNGTTVATITGDPDAPVISAADGRQLTSAEVQALVQIFGAGLMFLGELTDGVFGPAEIVF